MLVLKKIDESMGFKLKGFNLTFALAIFLLIQSVSNAQIWYFNNQSSLHFPGSIPNGAPALDAREAVGIVSDQNGAVVMYSNGVDLSNGNHQLQNQGNSLKGGKSATQGVLMVPSACNSCNEYFIFTVDDVENDFEHGLNVTKAIITGTAPATTITTGAPFQLLASPGGQKVKVAEKLAATSDGAGGYWVAVHGVGLYNGTNCVDTISCNFEDTFFFIHINSNTCNEGDLINTITSQSIGSVHRNSNYPYGSSGGISFNAQGQMKFSPDGSMLAVAIPFTRTVELFQFNNGVLSNPITIDTQLPGPFPSSGGIVYGLEFSPDNTKLYASSTYGSPQLVAQLDITVWQSWWINLTMTTLTSANSNGYTFGGMQLGPDNKIYIAKPGTPYFSVIHNPNVFGTSCDYINSGQPTLGNSDLGLPNILLGNPCEINPTGIANHIISPIKLKVFPNPVSENLTIITSENFQFKPGDLIEVFDYTGRCVLTQKQDITSSLVTIQLNDFSDGMYLFMYTTLDKIIIAERFIILR